MDLEQLLDTLEHAGRDARRQQELGEMIDRMAGEENDEHHHGTWWWVSRVAAAACVLFFISTAVRIWFIPTESAGTLVAEAEVPEVVLPAEPATPVEIEPAASVVRRPRVKPMPVQPMVEEQPEPVPSEEFFVEEIAEEDILVEEQEEEPVDNQIELIAQPVVSVAQTTETVPAQPEAVAAKPQERKRGLLSGLFHRAEPSMMDGSMLAFNLL